MTRIWLNTQVLKKYIKKIGGIKRIKKVWYNDTT